MGYDVFTSIMCPVNTKVWNPETKQDLDAPFVTIAEKHLKTLDNSFFASLCKVFLKDIINGRCIFSCSKGNGLCWAAEGNGTAIELVTDELVPFFIDLWNSGILFRFHGAVITTNGESEGKTRIAQIRLKPETSRQRPVVEDDVEVKFFEGEWYCKFDNN